MATGLIRVVKNLISVLQVGWNGRLESLKPKVQPLNPIVHEGSRASDNRAHFPLRVLRRYFMNFA